jgi:hypothetical protein
MVIQGSSAGPIIRTSIQQATQAQVEAETDIDNYVPPDLLVKHPGMAKAWCFISDTGALQTGSYNVASVTDVAVGQRTVVFDTDFADTNYIGVASHAHDSNAAINVGVLSTGKVEASIGVWIRDAEADSLVDKRHQQVFFGDQ